MSRSLTSATCFLIIGCSLAFAQLPERLENCLPIPTFAQEVREMQQGQPEQPAPKAIEFKNIHLIASGPLAISDQQVLSELKAGPLIEDGTNWPQEAITVIKDVLQSSGYFKASVEKPQVETIAGTKQQKLVNMIVRVDPGLQYRLSEMKFLKGTQFDEGQMRALFPVEQGDIFDKHKIGKGMEDLRRAYGEKGFVNFAAVPYLDFDDQHATIALTWELDEGKQFRVANFAILGLDPAVSNKVVDESGLKPGNVFNAKLLDDFFSQNKSVLPKDASAEDDVTRTLDERAGTVNLILDVRRCPTIRQ